VTKNNSPMATAKKCILACDVGGTRIKLGVARHDKLLAQCEMDAWAHLGLAPALERIAAAVPGLCAQAGIKPGKLAGLGLSFPGIVEPGTEKILSSPSGKFDDAKKLDVPDLVEQLLGLPARICNDANAALAGEWRFGAARGCRSVVMMTLGTGIGTSAIVEGVPLRGQHGQAGCLGGHLTVNFRGRKCLCGNAGCAESEASTWSLPTLAWANPGFATSQLACVEKLDYAALFRAAAQGDKLACDLRDRSLRVWSAALVNLIHAYDPECAIIGGGIMRSAGVILPRLRSYVGEHAWTPWGKVEIKTAALGNNAGMLGVASLFEEDK
jgi:glucokinase